jgi:hypothetical protein
MCNAAHRVGGDNVSSFATGLDRQARIGIRFAGTPGPSTHATLPRFGVTVDSADQLK